ncbi:MAG: cation diffusion facilitator family transporter [Firmicutes bacterium]|nr:cation diffusion facilitator family transporter [Bacillota bacterium]
MGDFLFKRFIKDYENTKDPKVRDDYGKFAGIVGIISNAVLCTMKILIGLISGSISIVADGINNLADGASSIITLLGFKLASLPEDEEHPYGHARIEYIAGMAVSVMILIVGFELGKSSLEKIITPEPLEFSWTVVIVLLIAIAIKVWQAMFNISTGKKINSLALIATGTDSRNDVIATIVVLLGILIGHFFDVMVDGYFGLAVAAFILWSGIGLIKETISPLLGEAPDEELVSQIEAMAMAYDGAIGIHDLIVHNYGPGKVFASMHIEVDSSVDVMESHDLIDTIEKNLSESLNILLTVHMDPVDINNPYREPLTHILKDVLSGIPGTLGFHDLRIVPGTTHTNVIFDVVLSHECELSQKEISDILKQKVSEFNSSFLCVIEYDMNYAGTKK